MFERSKKRYKIVKSQFKCISANKHGFAKVDIFEPLELSRYDHSSDIFCPKKEKGDIITEKTAILLFCVFYSFLVY